MNQITMHPFDSDYFRAAVYKEYSTKKNLFSSNSGKHVSGFYLTKLPGESSEHVINANAIKYVNRKISVRACV